MQNSYFLSLFVSLLLASQCFAENLGQPAVANDLPPSLHPGDVSLGFIHERSINNVIPDSLIQLNSFSNESQKGYFSEYAFIVDKSMRSLSIWKQTDLSWRRVGHYPTDMGKKSGDKTVLGDHKTPEGIYFFTHRYEGKSLDYSLYGSRAFATNYPNLYDKREGKTGSGIWLHAVPDSTPLTRGSRGCVVVRDNIIKKVTPYINLKKTPVIIQDSVKYVSLKKWKEKNSSMTTWLSEWLGSWNEKNLEKYMSFYSSDYFKSRTMGWEQWKNYKESINKKNNEILVRIQQPSIYSYKNEAVIQFLQNYKSDTVEDFGEKTLYLKRKNASFPWKIIAEEWKRVPTNVWLAETSQAQSQKLKARSIGAFNTPETIKKD